MDKATLLGIMLGFACLIIGIGGELPIFISPSSALITFGGTIAALFVSFPMRDVFTTWRITQNIFKFQVSSPIELINSLVGYAEVARRDGILALENVTSEITDDFLVRGIQLAVDGTDPELIDQILTTELDYIRERHSMGRSIYETLGKYAPAFGMIGTLIGLILMLKELGGSGGMEQIGKGMALALITTLYGAVASNLFFLPMADKLEKRSKEEQLLKEIIIRGVMSMQSGDNPRIVEQKLKIFLPPSEREAEVR